MYVIKMSLDKSLVSTIRTPIYAGESNVDTFDFIIPRYYKNLELQDNLIYLHYFLPGSTRYTEILLEDVLIYDEQYLRYPLEITPAFTSIAGDIKMRLVITDIDDNVILKSGDTKVRVLFPKECNHESKCHQSTGPHAQINRDNYLEERVRLLEDDSHTHENINLLDSITEEDIMRIAGLTQDGGGASVVVVYKHTQSLAATVWTITHNLNQIYVSVQVVSDLGNTLIPDVEYVSANSCKLSFSTLVQGTAIVRS